MNMKFRQHQSLQKRVAKRKQTLGYLIGESETKYLIQRNKTHTTPKICVTRLDACLT